MSNSIVHRFSVRRVFLGLMCAFVIFGSIPMVMAYSNRIDLQLDRSEPSMANVPTLVGMLGVSNVAFRSDDKPFATDRLVESSSATSGRMIWTVYPSAVRGRIFFGSGVSSGAFVTQAGW